MKTLCLVSLLALGLVIPGRIAAAEVPPPAKPAAAPAGKAASSAPSTRKVWTNADLAKLRTAPGSVTVLESAAGGGSMPAGDLPSLPESPGPQGVPARLQEMVTDAQSNLDRLERERLAATNPLLRGLAAGAPPRSIADIDKDRLKWSDRLRQAENALANAEGAPAPSN